MAQQPYQVLHYDERVHHGACPPVFRNSVPSGYNVVPRGYNVLVRNNGRSEEPVKKAPAPVKKRRRPNRSKGMPKRPLSAYNFFFSHERRRCVRSGALGRGKKGPEGSPKIGFAGLARSVADKWKAVDEESRRIYEDMADEEQIRYKREVDVWRRSKRRYPPISPEVILKTKPTTSEYGDRTRCTSGFPPVQPTPVDSPRGMTASATHASRMNRTHQTKCYSPVGTYGYDVPGTISVSTEVTNDGNDSLDLSPGHYGSYMDTPLHSPSRFDTYYSNNTSQSQRPSHPSHPGHYENFRNDSNGPIHSPEQYGTYYPGPVYSPDAYGVAHSGENGYAYPPEHYGSFYNNGSAQHMWSSAPPMAASRHTVNDCNPALEELLWRQPCKPGVSSLASMESPSLAGLEPAGMEGGEPYSISDEETGVHYELAKAESFQNINAEETGAHYELAKAESFQNIKAEETSVHYELGKAESFQNIMAELESEDNCCDVWSWLQDI
jgi:hypothetical protein